MQASHQQSRRQLQDTLTALSVAEVLSAAAQFFTQRSGIYAAFVEKQSATHVALRGQGGEEIVIGARETPAGTAVTGSSYLFDQQVARFLESLPPAPPEVVAADVPDNAVAGETPLTNTP